MADFVAFDKDYTNSFSIYDALDLKKKEINNDYYCLCTNPVFIKNESIEFTNKNNKLIQRHAHFSHFKNCICHIKKIYDKNDKNETNLKIGDAPENTELSKRIKIIFKILKLNKKSMKTYLNCKGNIDDIFRYANIHKINIDAFEEIMTDNIKKLINFKTFGIGFKDIEYREIEQNKIYHINDLFLDYDDDDKNNFGVISYSLIYNICNDFERYKIFVKKLSLITMFSSRCSSFDAFKAETIKFKEQAYEIIKKIRCLR